MPSNVIVLPLASGANTIHECFKGVYSHASNLEVNGLKIKDVVTGIKSEETLISKLGPR